MGGYISTRRGYTYPIVAITFLRIPELPETF